jgi:hypothetical protein
VLAKNFQTSARKRAEAAIRRLCITLELKLVEPSKEDMWEMRRIIYKYVNNQAQEEHKKKWSTITYSHFPTPTPNTK